MPPQELETSLDEGEARLRSAFDQADRAMTTTSDPGRLAARHTLQRYRTDYERLAAMIADTKAALQTTVARWGRFDAAYNDAGAWIRDAEVRLNCDTDLKGDLVEKRAQLEKTKVGAGCAQGSRWRCTGVGLELRRT